MKNTIKNQVLSYILLPVMILFCLHTAFAYKLEHPAPGTILIQHLKSNIQHHGFSIKENPFKYSGYYNDVESNNYYLNARYYSPALKRFVSRDTYDLPNRYAYCKENPFDNTDPNGHMSMLVNSGILGIGMALSPETGGVSDIIAQGIVNSTKNIKQLINFKFHLSKSTKYGMAGYAALAALGGILPLKAAVNRGERAIESISQSQGEQVRRLNIILEIYRKNVAAFMEEFNQCSPDSRLPERWLNMESGGSELHGVLKALDLSRAGKMRLGDLMATEQFNACFNEEGVFLDTTDKIIERTTLFRNLVAIRNATKTLLTDKQLAIANEVIGEIRFNRAKLETNYVVRLDNMNADADINNYNNEVKEIEKTFYGVQSKIVK